MDFKLVAEDFKKRYQKEPDAISFVGVPLIFGRTKSEILGTAMSVGGAVAVSKRDDGRIIAGFSDNREYINENIDRIPKGHKSHLIGVLEKVRDIGVKPEGAEILFYYNTPLLADNTLMALSSLSAFCENVPDKKELLGHFPDYKKSMIGLSSKYDCVTYICDNSPRHLRFPESRVKIVLSKIEDKITAGENNYIDDMVSALESLDLEKLGRLLNKGSEDVIRKNKKGKTAQLFRIAEKQKYALGSGVMETGGIFSIVENNMVDAFMENISSYYKRYFGGTPDFYVTRAEESGCFIATERFKED